ncbi:hypothetical protein ABZ540_36090 [Nocardia xishanensis]|uniref:hypothetical protein n=1 Tax=Nocardia xishanensis TaxID=238964 RepID=UPI0033D3193F
MSDPMPPQTHTLPTDGRQVDGLPQPGGGAAKTAAVLSLCFGIFMLGALILGVADAVTAISNDEAQFHPIGLVAVTVGAAMSSLGIYGGVQLFRRTKIGQRLVIAYSILFFAMTIWICIDQKMFNPLLPGWPVLIFLLAVNGTTFRWVEYESPRRPN